MPNYIVLLFLKHKASSLSLKSFSGGGCFVIVLPCLESSPFPRNRNTNYKVVDAQQHSANYNNHLVEWVEEETENSSLVLSLPALRSASFYFPDVI